MSPANTISCTYRSEHQINMHATLRHITTILFIATATTIAAQEFTPTFMSLYDRIGLGVRAGVAGHMQAGPQPLGFETMFDVQYAHYWRHDSWRQTQIGLITGLSFGFSRSSWQKSIHEQQSFTLTEDGFSFPLDYTIDMRIHEQDQQLQLEVPLLFSLIFPKGWFLHLGPRLQVPLAPTYRETISEDQIAAVYSLWSEEALINNPTTGCLSESQHTPSGTWRTTKVNLLLGAEAGYEYMFNDKNRLAFAAYGHAGVLPHKNHSADRNIVAITPPTPEDVAHIDVYGLSNTQSLSTNYFTAGIRIAYYFVW